MGKSLIEIFIGSVVSALGIYFLWFSFRSAESLGCELTHCPIPLYIQIYVIGVPLFGSLTFVVAGIFMVVRSLRARSRALV
ncbi:MAG: hypothetical protein ACYC7D_01540 [Nitrososphaerales archaeon]